MARPKGYKFKYRNPNRITKFTPDTVQKLEEAAGVRLNVKSMCAYAGVSRDTYYRWMKENPSLSDRLDDLRENPIMKAKRTIVSHLDDVNVAFRYLEKESPEEYGETLSLKHSGEVNTSIDTPAEDQEAIIIMRKTLKENMLKRRTELAKQKGEIPT